MLPTTLELSGRQFEIAQAVREDVAELVGLLADDVLGSQRENASLKRYQQAFEEISADPNQLLTTVRNAEDALVSTMQLTLIPGLSRGAAKRMQIEAVRLAARLLRTLQAGGKKVNMMALAPSEDSTQRPANLI